MKNDRDIPRRGFLAGSAAGAALIFGSAAAPGRAHAPEKAMTGADFRNKLLECLGGAWPEPGDFRPTLRETIR